MSERRFLAPGCSPLRALLQGPVSVGVARIDADDRESRRAEGRERARRRRSVWIETVLPVTSAVATLGLVVMALLISYL